MEINFLAEPLARGLDLESERAGEVQRQILHTKLPLRHAYESVYHKMLSAAERHLSASGGVRVELGSGGGFLTEVDPSIITSDVRAIPGLDVVCDARRLPFRDGSLDAIFALHVLHHIPDVRLFLAEAGRCLSDGGGVVAVEPYWSPLARLMYARFHPEPFDPEATEWGFENAGAMASNQALSYILLERDRAELGAEFPDLEIVGEEPFGGPSYLLTGGIWRRQVLPSSWLVRLWDLEDRTRFWRRSLALHHLFVIRRRT